MSYLPTEKPAEEGDNNAFHHFPQNKHSLSFRTNRTLVTDHYFLKFSGIMLFLRPARLRISSQKPTPRASKNSSITSRISKFAIISNNNFGFKALKTRRWLTLKHRPVNQPWIPVLHRLEGRFERRHMS